MLSSPLTVNFIPTGLGSRQAPGSNRPTSILFTTINPQALNRYSYVVNNPLSYVDPTGEFVWWPVLWAIVVAYTMYVDVEVATHGPYVEEFTLAPKHDTGTYSLPESGSPQPTTEPEYPSQNPDDYDDDPVGPKFTRPEPGKFPSHFTKPEYEGPVLKSWNNDDDGSSAGGGGNNSGTGTSATEYDSSWYSFEMYGYLAF